MRLIDAMSACLPGMYVARRSFPDKRYFKDHAGIFGSVLTISYTDFIAHDWDAFVFDRFRLNWTCGISGNGRPYAMVQNFPVHCEEMYADDLRKMAHDLMTAADECELMVQKEIAGGVTE